MAKEKDCHECVPRVDGYVHSEAHIKYHVDYDTREFCSPSHEELLKAEQRLLQFVSSDPILSGGHFYVTLDIGDGGNGGE